MEFLGWAAFTASMLFIVVRLLFASVPHSTTCTQEELEWAKAEAARRLEAEYP